MQASDTSTMQEVCAQFKCGRKRVYALIRNERFPKYARIGRKNFFYNDAIAAWRLTRPDLFPPDCFADSESLPRIVGLDPSMEKMYKRVQEEKREHEAADREREEREKELAKYAACERAAAKEREQRQRWRELAPPSGPIPIADRKSALNPRKVRATLKANKLKYKKGK